MNKKVFKIILILSLIIGISLRLGFVLSENFHFSEDHIRSYVYSLDFHENKNKHTFGPGFFGRKEAGFIPGNIYYILAYIPLAIYKSPTSIALFMCLLNIASIFLLYILLRQLRINFFLRYLTIILYVTSAWSLSFGCGIIHYKYLPFFILLILVLSVKLIQNKSKHWLLSLIIFISFLIPQFHLMAIFIIPFIIVLLVINKIKIKPIYLLIGIILGVSLYLPYLLNELNTDFANTKLMLKSGSRFAPLETLKLFSSLIVTGSGEISSKIGNKMGVYSYASFSFSSIFIAIISFLLLTTITIMSFIHFFGYCFKQGYCKSIFKKRTIINNECFFYLWLIVPSIFFIIMLNAFQPRYSIIFFPCIQFVIAFFYYRIYNEDFILTKNIILQKVLKYSIYAFIVLQLHVFISYKLFTNKKTDYFLVYNKVKSICKYIKTKSKNNEFFIADKKFRYLNPYIERITGYKANKKAKRIFKINEILNERR